MRREGHRLSLPTRGETGAPTGTIPTHLPLGQTRAAGALAAWGKVHGPGGSQQLRRCFLMPAWKALAPSPQRRNPRPRGVPTGHPLPGVATVFLPLPQLCPCWEGSSSSGLQICPLPSAAHTRHFLRDLPEQALAQSLEGFRFHKERPALAEGLLPWRLRLRALYLSWGSPVLWG